MTTPRLSVVIVTYRSRGVIDSCLRSLNASASRVAHEILVVDNGSGDGLCEWMREAWPDVRLTANPDNRGFTRGVNQGLEAARGDALLVLNPDCEVTEQGLERLFAALAADPRRAAVAPMLVDARGRPARSCGRFPTLWSLACEHLGLIRLFPRSRWFAGYKYGDLDLVSLGAVGWCSGAALMMSRAAYLRLGGLDEKIFMYMEEVDWCRRAQKAGLEIRFVPDARFVHTGQHASRQAVEATYLHNLRSRVYYVRKHHGAFHAAIVKAILAASLVGKWLATRAGWSHAGEPRLYARGLETVWAA